MGLPGIVGVNNVHFPAYVFFLALVLNKWRRCALAGRAQPMRSAELLTEWACPSDCRSR
jgi:hypothetical protein